MRVIRLLELSRRQAVRDRTQLIQRLRALWVQIDPQAEDAVVACHRKKVLARLRVISFGHGLAAEVAGRSVRQLAADIERLNLRIAQIEDELAELLERHGNPVADLHGAGATVASALIAQAGDVRRFRSPAAFGRYSGTAPIPCGSGQSAGRHRLHRGGNRQLPSSSRRRAPPPEAVREIARARAAPAGASPCSSSRGRRGDNGGMGRDELERGRTSYAQRAWGDAYESLARVDREAPLAPEDLELLATTSYMLGRDDEQLQTLERAHHGYVNRGDWPRAVRCAFWLGVHLMVRGEIARTAGWFGRAERLLDHAGRDCVERGYLLVATDLRHRLAGDLQAAAASAAAAAEVAERFGDADLLALALMDQGGYLVRQERVEEGLGKLDEAMVAATAGELSPIVTGLVYCSVIESCQEAHELRRASEWTAALTRWCDRQPGLVPFTGTCLIHRAELMQITGEWGAALEEARLAAERFALRSNELAAGQASYRQGEVLRLQGDLAAAEQAYRDASRCGYEPQPGLALLLLAQGRTGAAAAAIDQVLAGTTEWVERSRLLPACVEIMLAADDRERARSACAELEGIAASLGSAMLRALAGRARGAVELADGDARAALVALRRAWRLWHDLDAPYEAARARVLIAQACRSLGDDETSALELEAARSAFAHLGAAPDLALVDSLVGTAASGDAAGLTARELQVLRLVAAGESNKAIAAELGLSKRTVDRHVSNIFAKLRVSTRAAATAFAYEHELI